MKWRFGLDWMSPGSGGNSMIENANKTYLCAGKTITKLQLVKK